ncbi:pyroglutamyl-peptidase I [Azospirillum halopraeferens]|uniref:pyroglutamyl-peptidase I n=1 Tax=Azospirillum halopraeferens TaxID=34010 RepID=UPI0003F9A89A|nr:pyroglutamyl-peptidase I [Azospirillum halopraeferens]
MGGPILLTGFQPFDGHEANPTALLMERLAGAEGVVTAVLPVEYDTCAAAFDALLEQHDPIAALSFGLSFRTESVLVERLAWNRDESPKADNAGVVREDAEIVPGGPTAYGCGIPVPLLVRTLARAGLPVAISDHAGGFVCNQLYYRARHRIATVGPDVPMAFLHVPPLPDQVAGQAGRSGLAPHRLEEGVRALLGALRRALGEEIAGA